jgi:hypothetical protein
MGMPMKYHAITKIMATTKAKEDATNLPESGETYLSASELNINLAKAINGNTKPTE